MNKPDKQQLQGALGTILFHLIVLLILLLVGVEMPPQEQEAGVSVIMGNVEKASDGYRYTEVKVAPEPSRVMPAPAPSKVEEPVITQKDEPTVEVPDAKESSKEKPKPKTPQEEAAERAAQEAERRRLEAERIAREASERMANAFSKNAKNKGAGEEQTEAEGSAGSPESVQTTGITKGMGGYGSFDLSGRSLAGNGELPRPEYNVQDEGRVVVNITVNPEGRVISTSINQRTNTVNPSLRQAALKAAAKAQFNAVGGVNNQMGTITYYFKLK